MRVVCPGKWLVVVSWLPLAAFAQGLDEGPGPHFGVFLGVAGASSTAASASDVPRTGGGVGLVAELGAHLDAGWSVSVSGGGFHSVDSSLLELTLVAHRAFAEEFFGLGAGVGAFTLPGQATVALTVPLELEFLPIFGHGGKPLFGLGIKLRVSPGVDVGTGRFAISGGLHVAALVVD